MENDLLLCIALPHEWRLSLFLILLILNNSHQEGMVHTNSSERAWKKGLVRCLKRDISRLWSHWSSSYITALSLVKSFKGITYFQSDATPALLCHKEPAQGTLSPLCTMGISCLSLVPYGIKIGGFNARKESVIGGPYSLYHKAWIYLPKRNRSLIVLTEFDK